MRATIMDGRALAAKVQAEVAGDVAGLGDVGLATVLVGDDPASHIYIRRKHEAAQGVGIRSDDRRLPADISQEELIAIVEELNDDDSIDGILVQSPLPKHLDEAKTIEALDPAKDVDGFHPTNAGLLYLGRPALVPATPLGVMRLLDEYRVQIAGARAVVIGRSNIVGKPMAHLLLKANATVSIAHSQTVDLGRLTTDADIVVAAVGVAHLVAPDMIKAGATVVDVGMNRTDAGLVGDVDPGAAERAGLITPVPGGVGPMTIAMLLANTVKAARARRVANPAG
ncbi:MAG: bifunctional 5,10-methylenetetrahydrofolate dehydrogenase/5,10-methenyltetrahydrofolate cyclohydrolase [Actinobacteria bacterium]|nr:MAG: bifunctional 5,10-methylenetetrahydrofolate dehydrogenase/5,10-methenyltetrahydrofolate cyclohydrolase [Actinomycetota bacterium]